MKDNDSKLIAEAYNEGVMSAFGGAAKSIGKAAGKTSLAVGGTAAKGTGIALDGIMKAVNYLTSDQLKKLGDYCLKKASENEEDTHEDGEHEDGENC
tara:strand:- start:147 stop:437 length:291 start_codon:yes stop_codon:yes gene_type:complete